MHTTADSSAQPMGVIEALQTGFAFVNRHPWLLIAPVVLDLALWRGPRFAISTLLLNAIQPAFSTPGLPPELTANIELVKTTIGVIGQSFSSLLVFLASSLADFPSLFARLGAGSTPAAEFVNLSQVLVYAVLLLGIVFSLASVWLALVVRMLDDKPADFSKFLRRAAWIWINLGLYVLGLVAATIAATFVLGLFVGAVVLVTGGGAAFANILGILFFWLILWIGLGLTFVVDAIALDGVNVAQATWRSINVVGRNLNSTIGLALLAFLLTEGFARIWLWLSSNTWGMPISILGSAYIGAALTAASLQFYRARYQHWQRLRSTLLKPRQE